MNKMKKIYLAGSVPKSDHGSYVDWREDVKKILGDNYEYISPLDSRFPENDFFGVFGQDCHLIKNCDIVFVDASSKLGVGTSQEMIVAKYFKKPVITYLPKDTHHRRSNIILTGYKINDWIHPFIYSVSDIIIGNLDDAYEALSRLDNIKIKDIGIIDEGVRYFEEWQ